MQRLARAYSAIKEAWTRPYHDNHEGKYVHYGKSMPTSPVEQRPQTGSIQLLPRQEAQQISSSLFRAWQELIWYEKALVILYALFLILTLLICMTLFIALI